jgi:signal transduction histidine kinase
MEEEGIRSYVNVPLMARGELIGSLNLAANEPNPWTQEHLKIATELATQLSVAIDQARLLETAERNAIELEALHKIGLELTAQLDLKTLLEVLIEQAVGLIKAESGSLYLAKPEEGVLQLAAITNRGDFPIHNQIERGAGVTGYAWEVDQTILVGNYGEWPRRLPGFEQMKKAVLSIPIRWGNEITGVLNFIGQKPYAFTVAHVQLMELLAAQAAIAIHNAQLHEQIQEYVVELEKQNAELERFTYTVSHDLKSPLVTVNGFLGFLEKDLVKGDDKRIAHDIERIRDATRRMQTLLDDLLELSRIGRLINPPQTVAFNKLVEEALVLVSGRINQVGAEVVIMPDLPLVQVDQPRMIEVLQNLIDNGAKYMGSQTSPRIEIGAETRGNEPVFFVRDNGIGIESKYHEKVFGLFERIEQTTEGTGIGLALAKRIVEVHNGRIWIESEGLGQGTAVCFTLPSFPAQEA